MPRKPRMEQGPWLLQGFPSHACMPSGYQSSAEIDAGELAVTVDLRFRADSSRLAWTFTVLTFRIQYQKSRFMKAWSTQWRSGLGTFAEHSASVLHTFGSTPTQLGPPPQVHIYGNQCSWLRKITVQFR